MFINEIGFKLISIKLNWIENKIVFNQGVFGLENLKYKAY